MNKPKMSIHIEKSRRGWSIETIVVWPGVLHPAITHGPGSSLAHSLWSSIDKTMDITEITVKGKGLSNKEAYQIIEKSLRGGSLEYALPEYKAALGL